MGIISACHHPLLSSPGLHHGPEVQGGPMRPSWSCRTRAKPGVPVPLATTAGPCATRLSDFEGLLAPPSFSMGGCCNDSGDWIPMHNIWGAGAGDLGLLLRACQTPNASPMLPQTPSIYVQIPTRVGGNTLSVRPLSLALVSQALCSRPAWLSWVCQW